jgi:hypothetical protein
MRAPQTDEAAHPRDDIAAALRQRAATRRFPAWRIGHALDHHYKQYPAFIPPAQPAHAPAIQVIAHLHRPKQSQELGFNMHSPLRTCMALPPPEVNPPFRSRLQKLNEQALSFQQTELF